MKKIVRFIAMITTIAFAMCGCSLFATDDVPAIVEMTTESGRAVIAMTYNGLGYNQSGSVRAIRNGYVVQTLDAEDTVSVHFYCEACGYGEECELTAPDSEMFECECPEEGDENNNAKEYFALIVEITSSIGETETTE